MSFIVDESTIFNTDIEITSFAPLKDVKIDDYFFIQIATQDNDEVELEDSTGWTMVVNASVTQCEAEVWYKKVTSDDEVPTGIDNTGTDNTWANISVIRGLDTTDPIDDSGGSTGSSATATCPAATSSQTNQIALRLVATDGANIAKPLTLQTIDYEIDAWWGFELVDIASTGTLGMALAVSDQWAAITVILKRASGDTSKPIQTSDGLTGYDTITEKTGMTHNGDQWRQEVYDSGECLDYSSARRTWSVDLASSHVGGYKILRCDGFSSPFSLGNVVTFTGGFTGTIKYIDQYDSNSWMLTVHTYSGTDPISNEVGTESGTGYTCLMESTAPSIITVDEVRINAYMETGRSVYISGMSTLGVTDDFYFIIPGGYGISNAYSTFYYKKITTDAPGLIDGTQVTLTPNVTGTGTFTDSGMLIKDYNASSPYAYPLGTSGANCWNVNIVGNNRVFTSAADLSDELMAIFWKPGNTGHNKAAYFWACDDAGAWKFWKISPAALELKSYFCVIDFDSTETPIRSYGTFDATNVKYYAILFQDKSATNRYAITTFTQYELNSMIVTGGGSSISKKLWQVQKWLSKTPRINGVLFDDFMKSDGDAYTITGNLTFGNGANTSYLDNKNNLLQYPAQADGVIYTAFNVDPDVTGIEFNGCNGNWNTSIISAGGGYRFELTANNNIDLTGDILVRAVPVLQDGKTEQNVTFVECKQIVKNAAVLDTVTISDSQTSDGALLLDTADSGTLADVSFKDSAGYDIEILGVVDFTMTGVTFDSPGIKNLNVKAVAGTLNITIAGGGDTPTYDTAGATVNILTPPTTYTFEMPNIVDGSRFQIYNVTSTTELTNALTSGGTGIDETYTEGTHYTAGDTGRYRVTYQSGTAAKHEIEGTFTFPAITAVNSLPEAQVAQSVYADYGVDGSAITEFAWDNPNLEIDITDPDNTTEIQRVAAWYYYHITTSSGIDEVFGTIVWSKINEVLVDAAAVDMKLDNQKVTPLLLTGGRMYRSDGATIIAALSESIHLDYDPVYQLETGVSGLTGPESTQLMSLGDPDENAEAVASKTIAGYDHDTLAHALVHADYGGCVFIDTSTGNTGTTYPTGTREKAVNNLADALTLCANHNKKNLHIIGELTVSGAEVLDGYTIHADRPLTNEITITDASTEGTFFENITVSGKMDGEVKYTNCIIDDVTDLKGGVKNSLLLNNLDLVTAARAIYLIDVDSLVSAVDEYVVIEINAAKLNMIRCHGNFALRNKTGTDMTYVGMIAGKLKIESTCTAGSVFIVGGVEVVDESGPGCTVYVHPVESNLKQIDGDSVAGNLATLTLKALSIVNPDGTALLAKSTGSDGHGINTEGNGAGYGIQAKGGATGHGIMGRGGSTSGNGVYALSIGAGYGAYLRSSAAAVRAALRIEALASGANAIEAIGKDGGSGARIQGGITGVGMYLLGGSTSGDGLKAHALGDGFGIQAIAGGGDRSGMRVKGEGAGAGLLAEGGATGKDIDADELEGSPSVLIDTTIAVVTDQTHFTLTAGSDVDEAYEGQAVVLYDASNSDYPSVRVCTEYAGATKTITLDEAPGFTIIAGDGVKAFVASGSAGSGGSGSGSNQVDLTIEEADTTPIPDVKISIMNSDSTVLIATGITDSNGDATFALNDGSYKALLSRIGWTFTVPEDLTVDESPEAATYNGTEVSVGSPPSADVCRLYEYCVDQTGSPLPSVTSYAAIIDKPFDDGEGAYDNQKGEGTYSSGTGLIYWDIVRGAKILVEIQEIGLYREYTVPDQTDVRLGDLT